MAVAQHRRDVISRGHGRVVRDSHVYTDDAMDDHVAVRSSSIASTLATIVYGIGTLIVSLLLLRFLLSLLGANPSNAIADFIYDTSQPFVAPFFGLFNYNTQFGISRFEIETLIAAISYGLLTWLLVNMIETLNNREV
jgi:YggT family protein